MDVRKWRVVKDPYWGWAVYRPGVPASTGFGCPATYINPGWAWRQAFNVALHQATRSTGATDA